MSALKYKLDLNLQERLKLRDKEHTTMIYRYNNVKKEIENSQKLERIKFEKNMASYIARAKNALRPPSAQGSMMTSKMSRMGTSRMSTSVSSSKIMDTSKMIGASQMMNKGSSS